MVHIGCGGAEKRSYFLGGFLSKDNAFNFYFVKDCGDNILETRYSEGECQVHHRNVLRDGESAVGDDEGVCMA